VASPFILRVLDTSKALVTFPDDFEGRFGHFDSRPAEVRTLKRLGEFRIFSIPIYCL
jgi:hypothetical protein